MSHAATHPWLSVIVPVFNEAASIVQCLAALAPLRARGVEIVVADGGSNDATAALAAPLCDRLERCARGRAHQMNAGAAVARGEVLLFLHADATLPAHGDQMILNGLAASRRQWGRFDVRLSGRQPLLRVVEFSMNWRSRLTGIATGDQGLFMTRAAFTAAGGFPEIALLEDIAMSASLKRLGRPLCLRAPICASSRRWERDGTLRTIVTMWSLRLRYFLGANPANLARIYYRHER